MDIGFIGLGNMGFPMMRRLVDSGHDVVVFDARPDVVANAVAVGAAQGASVRDVADRAETVLASLPSLQASLDVATGADGVVTDSQVRRLVDFSIVGHEVAQRIHANLADAGIAALDNPVSGGVAGAQNGTLAVMVSGVRTEFDTAKPAPEAIGRPIPVSEKPGTAQNLRLRLRDGADGQGRPALPGGGPLAWPAHPDRGCGCGTVGVDDGHPSRMRRHGDQYDNISANVSNAGADTP